MVGGVWAYRGAFAVSSAASLGLVLKLGPRQRLVALATASSAALLGVFSFFSLRSKLLQDGKTDKEREQEQSDLALVEVLRQTSAFGAELPEGVTVIASYSKNHAASYLVPQQGPVCAAASVSGALNMLFDRPTDKPGAWKFQNTLAVYKFMFGRKRDEAVAKLAKVLRIPDATSCLELMRVEAICVAARGTGKKALFIEHLSKALETAAGSEHPPPQELLDALRGVLSTSDGPASALVIDRLKKVAKAEWAIAKLEGRWMLSSGKMLSSTAPIGNDSLATACRALAQFREEKPVRVVPFMGQQSACRIIVSSKDSEDTQLVQWEELQRAIERTDAALIFHLHNHYALITGWRELAVPQLAGARRRQILTARTGQVQAHWVDWAGDYTVFLQAKDKTIMRKSVRTTLRCWKGHKIMLVEKVMFTSKRERPDPVLKSIVEHLRQVEAALELEEAVQVEEGLIEEEGADDPVPGEDDDPEA